MKNNMIIKDVESVPAIPVDRCEGAFVQILLGSTDSMPNFYTRRFTLEAAGHIPLHSHPDIEHEQLVLEGQFELLLEGRTQTLRQGDCVYLPAGLIHGYRNPNREPARFLCVVPATDSYRTDWME